MVDYQAILDRIEAEIQPLLGQGRVATYIPPLAEVDPRRFGMAVRLVNGREFHVGEADHAFSIQSVSKAFRLAAAAGHLGEAIWNRVGREASGTAFNSLIQLEEERGVPRNPMINAGALVVMDALLGVGSDESGGDSANPGIEFIGRCLACGEVTWDRAVSAAELETAHRNRALAHLLKSFGNLNGDPDAVVAAHCRESAVTLTCRELCNAGLFMATGGVSADGLRVCTPRQIKRLNAVLLTCGVYDEAGDYAYRVGLPAKSGVGGGVLAVMPGAFTACVWSPGLNAKGNSLAGTMALELLTTLTGVSVF